MSPLLSSQYLEHRLARFPRHRLAHAPTPLERLNNLSADFGQELWVKRDDCTGIGLGGNKIRQLEWYFGQALQEQADTVLITGAVQSNFVRATAAVAAKLGMTCHIQLEERVPDVSEVHRANGNVLLDRLFGAVLHSFPEGEDEVGADRALSELALELRQKGCRPFVIPLGLKTAPTGALGYVAAAIEVSAQLSRMPRPPEAIVIASGSALTHAGLLLGLRLLGVGLSVYGVCVRRPEGPQTDRVSQRVKDTARLLDVENPVASADIRLTDVALAPGYGQLNAATRAAIHKTARREGLLLDPVYTGKTMAGLIDLVTDGPLQGQGVLLWHTGGQPALFGYGDELL